MIRKTLTLAEPWTYRDPTLTIDFAPGSHEVERHIHEAAEAAGVIAAPEKKEKADGDGLAKTAAASAAAKAEG